VAFQHQLETYENIGWMREIPEPYEALDNTPESLEREVVEKEEMMKDKGELRMFNLFAEAVEALYTGMVDKFVRKTPALWEEFAMKTSTSAFYLLDPDPYVGLQQDLLSTTISSSHLVCAFGQLIRSWLPLVRLSSGFFCAVCIQGVE